MDFNTIYNIAVTTGMGVLGFFMKHFFDKLNSRASRAEVDEIKRTVREFDDKYARKAELQELKQSVEKIITKIDDIKDSSVRNEDFIRTMARLENKIDEMRREHN